MFVFGLILCFMCFVICMEEFYVSINKIPFRQVDILYSIILIGSDIFLFMSGEGILIFFGFCLMFGCIYAIVSKTLR
mgnify:CR=1 FL=1